MAENAPKLVLVKALLLKWTKCLKFPHGMLAIDNKIHKNGRGFT
jgi:hypothetical protein